MRIDNYYDILNKICIFNNIERDNLIELFNSISYRVCKIKKNYLLLKEKSKCEDVSILLEGKVVTQKNTRANKTIIIDKFISGDIIAAQAVFAEDNRYMADTYTLTDCVVMYIPKDQFIKICINNETVLENLIAHICTKNQKLLDKIDYLASGSIRNKINKFICDNYINSDCCKIKLNMSKTDLSECLGIERTSLSRELKKMKDEGLIDFDRKTISILKLEDFII